MSALPNLITALRVLLIGPAAWLLWQARYQEALVIVVVAGLSDWLDGLLARHYGWTSRFGAAMDPAADKLLMLTVIVVLTLQDHLPLWLAVLLIGRDVVITAGAGAYRLMFGDIQFQPSFISKTNTVLQIVVLSLILLMLAYPDTLGAWGQPWVDPWGFYLLAVFAVLSGGDYVLTWSRKALTRRREEAQAP